MVLAGYQVVVQRGIVCVFTERSDAAPKSEAALMGFVSVTTFYKSCSKLNLAVFYSITYLIK